MLDDPEMRELAEGEIAELLAQRDALDSELNLLLLPKDARDDANIFLEVRAGTGGDEAAIFAGDLFRMYARYAETQRLARRNTVVESRRARRFQGGRSRASRARACSRSSSSNQALIACSACRKPRRRAASTPRLRPWRFCPRWTKSKTSIELRDADLKVDTFRASRSGRPARQQDRLGDPHHAPAERHRRRVPGRTQPAQEPRARAVPAQGAPARRANAQSRPRNRPNRGACRSVSGDRSQRIRTYNFPQGRITDHRINLTLYRLPEVIDGDLDPLIGPLALEYRAEQMQSLTENGLTSQ